MSPAGGPGGHVVLAGGPVEDARVSPAPAPAMVPPLVRWPPTPSPSPPATLVRPGAAGTPVGAQLGPAGRSPGEGIVHLLFVCPLSTLKTKVYRVTTDI